MLVHLLRQTKGELQSSIPLERKIDRQFNLKVKNIKVQISG